MLLFVACLVEFIILPGFGTSVFLLLTLMCFIDVVAGFTVTISTARRDFGVEEGLRRQAVNCRAETGTRLRA